MADAITLPSDLYDPVLAYEYTAYQWFENNSLLNKFARAGDATAPIRLNAHTPTLMMGGTVVHAPVFKPIASVDTARDLTSQTDVDTLKITTRDDKGVRISRKVGPISFSKSAEWLSGLQAGQLEQFFATEVLNNMKLTMRQYVIGATKAAITNMTSSLHTASVWNATTRTNLSTNLLAQIKAKLSDRGEIFEPGTGSAWVFHPDPLQTDLFSFQSGQGVQGIADVAGRGEPLLTLGLPYAMAADAALTTADAGFDKYYSLLLGPGSIELDVIRMDMTPLWMNPKSQNVQFVLRADYDFELRVPGMTWDVTNGGTNPSLTAASLSTNWDPTYTDAREIPMAMGEHNFSAN